VVLWHACFKVRVHCEVLLRGRQLGRRRRVHKRFCLLDATSTKQAQKMRNVGPAIYQGCQLQHIVHGTNIAAVVCNLLTGAVCQELVLCKEHNPRL
jgi:hypothetical protein